MIDWQRVGALRDEIGADDFEEVVTLFLEEADEIVSKLETSPQQGELAADMHTLKGSALNLGFRDFAQICADGERYAEAGDFGSVDLYGAIDAYRSAKTTFQGEMATRFA